MRRSRSIVAVVCLLAAPLVAAACDSQLAREEPVHAQEGAMAAAPDDCWKFGHPPQLGIYDKGKIELVGDKDKCPWENDKKLPADLDPQKGKIKNGPDAGKECTLPGVLPNCGGDCMACQHGELTSKPPHDPAQPPDVLFMACSETQTAGAVRDLCCGAPVQDACGAGIWSWDDADWEWVEDAKGNPKAPLDDCVKPNAGVGDIGFIHAHGGGELVRGGCGPHLGKDIRECHIGKITAVGKDGKPTAATAVAFVVDCGKGGGAGGAGGAGGGGGGDDDGGQCTSGSGSGSGVGGAASAGSGGAAASTSGSGGAGPGSGGHGPASVSSGAGTGGAGGGTASSSGGLGGYGSSSAASGSAGGDGIGGAVVSVDAATKLP